MKRLKTAVVYPDRPGGRGGGWGNRKSTVLLMSLLAMGDGLLLSRLIGGGVRGNIETAGMLLSLLTRDSWNLEVDGLLASPD